MYTNSHTNKHTHVNILLLDLSERLSLTELGLGLGPVPSIIFAQACDVNL